MSSVTAAAPGRQSLHERVSVIVRLLCAQQETAEADLAEVLGVHRSRVWRSLNGDRKWQVDDLQALAEFFDVDPGLFFADPAGAVDAARVIRYVVGDATQPVEYPAIIAHICNNEGKWGRGFSRALSRRSRAPELSYRAWHSLRDSSFGLGRSQIVQLEPDRLWVANMVAQDGVGPSREPRVRYDALEATLAQVAEDAQQLAASVHMPRIGCGLGGGRWDQVGPLVEAAFCRTGVGVFVYELPD